MQRSAPSGMQASWPLQMRLWRQRGLSSTSPPATGWAPAVAAAAGAPPSRCQRSHRVAQALLAGGRPKQGHPVAWIRPHNSVSEASPGRVI